MRSRHACCHWPSAKNLQRSQCCDCNPVARICCWVRDNRHRPGARNLPRSPSRLSPMVEPLWWYTNVPRCRHVVNGGSNCDMHKPCMTLQYKVLYTSCGLGPHVKPQQEWVLTSAFAVWDGEVEVVPMSGRAATTSSLG